MRSHLRYLERDGVSREGEPGRFYSTFADDADGKAFAERGAGDRHQFRFIVAPEDGPAFDHLRDFTRDLMAKMEEDLGTTLDWVAVDHFDTGHPHSHILVRGITEDGKTLNIAGDYIAHGIRHRGSQIMTQALGPQSELEVRHQLEREVDAERLTRLDRMMLAPRRATRSSTCADRKVSARSIPSISNCWSPVPVCSSGWNWRSHRGRWPGSSPRTWNRR